MKPVVKLSLFFIVWLLLLSGCTSNENVYPEAKAIAERYFQAAGRGDVDAVMALYGESFFEQKGVAQWAGQLADLWHQLGTPFEHTLQSASMRVSTAGTEALLTYTVGYSGGMIGDATPGVEKLVFLQSPAGTLQLVDHRFSNNAAE